MDQIVERAQKSMVLLKIFLGLQREQYIIVFRQCGQQCLATVVFILPKHTGLLLFYI